MATEFIIKADALAAWNAADARAFQAQAECAAAQELAESFKQDAPAQAIYRDAQAKRDNQVDLLYGAIHSAVNAGFTLSILLSMGSARDISADGLAAWRARHTIIC